MKHLEVVIPSVGWASVSNGHTLGSLKDFDDPRCVLEPEHPAIGMSNVY